MFRLINAGMAQSRLDAGMLFLSSQYTWIVAAVFFLGYALCRLERRLLVFCLSLGLTIGATDFVTYRFLKMTIERERPCHQLENVRLVPVRCGSDFGFPSNHAANAMATAVSVALVAQRPWATGIALVAALLIGLSRVYLGVHFPGDVLAGFAVGAAVAFICHLTMRRLWLVYEKRRTAPAAS